MKKCIGLFLFLVLLIVAFVCSAETTEPEVFTSGDYKYILLEDGTVKITKYSGKAEELIIPDELDGRKVTNIGDKAFSLRDFSSVIIPDSVTNIGENPFRGCSNLTYIVVSPDHPYLATIDGVLFSKPDKRLVCYPCAFEDESYAIPSGILSIGDSAFWWSDYLKSVTIPDTVHSVGINPFMYCSKLSDIIVSPDHPYLATKDGVLFSKSDKKLICYPEAYEAENYTIPSEIQIIGYGSFSGCGSLNSVTIPESVTIIGDMAFNDCGSLTSIIIPDSVTFIGISAFHDCESLTSVVIPANVNRILDYTFYGCKSLSSVTIPNSVTSIGYCAFYHCNSLSDIVIPDSVTCIEGLAFDKCSFLKSISIPDNVKSIGDKAFDMCGYLTITVERDSYAAQYCKTNGLRYIYPDSLDWLNN